jgi:TRAP-type C4-dicarboxylate transport system permease small subunit
MKKIMHISTIVGKIINWLSILALLVMIVVTIVDVFLRVAFKSPITGSVEIVRMMMVCMAPSFISALFQGRHVSVGLFVDNLGRKWQLAFDTFGYGLSAVLCGIMCYQGYIDMLKKLAQNQTYTMLKIPTWPFYLIFSVSMGLLAIAIVIELINHFWDKKKYMRPVGQESEKAVV